MDRATKIYAAILAVLAVALLIGVFYESPKVAELNGVLEADRQVADFPYRFHVMRMEDGTAVLSTPRDTSMPVYRVLGVIFPNLEGKGPDDPEFQKAQRRLAAVQKRARSLVISQPDVQAVRWELDEQWLLEHGLVTSG
jgi:hypothetical protein